MMNQARTIVIPPSIAEAVNSPIQAMVLAQLCYWTTRSENEEGWVYKTGPELSEELSGLRKKTSVNNTLRKLTEAGLLERRQRRSRVGKSFEYRPNRSVKSVDIGVRYLGSAPDGSRITPDGSRITPDGMRSTPDGSRPTSTGMRPTPDGMRSTPDGSRPTPIKGTRATEQCTEHTTELSGRAVGRTARAASDQPDNSPPEDLDGEALEIWCLLEEGDHPVPADDARQLTDYLNQWHPSALHYVERRCGVDEPFADDIRRRFDDTQQLLRALCEDGRADGTPQKRPGSAHNRDNPQPEDQTRLTLEDDGGVWETALSRIRDRLDPDDFESWFEGPIRAGGVDGYDQLVLVCDDEFVVEWVQGHYLGLIEDAVASAAGQPMDVRLEDGRHIEIHRRPKTTEGAA